MVRSLVSVPCPRCRHDWGWGQVSSLSDRQSSLLFLVYVASMVLGGFGLFSGVWPLAVFSPLALGMCSGFRWLHLGHRCLHCGLLVKWDMFGRAHPWQG